MQASSTIPNAAKAARKRAAFTLIELLTAMSVTALILSLLLTVVGNVSGVWAKATDRTEAFRDSRLAFGLMSRELSAATLNSYLDYDDPVQPTAYLRKSDLAFVIGGAGQGAFPGDAETGQALFFQAPLGVVGNSDAYGGLSDLLNACGYFVEFGPDLSRPSHVDGPGKYRYRLMQVLVPSESNTVYTASGDNWFSQHYDKRRVVADNVIALVARPMDPTTQTPLSADFTYDSRLGATDIPQPQTAARLPPVVSLTLVTIDETSAKHLENGSAKPAAITQALAGKFTAATAFDSDLKNLARELTEAGIQYRIFTSAVPLKESTYFR